MSHNNPERIFIYGPPGSGKSAVAASLAGALSLPDYDLDAEIEARSRTTIPEIFQQEGEAGFRQRERQALNQLLQRGRGVFALGGGALLDGDNRRLVENAGQVACLAAPVTVLLERLQASAGERPLLSDDLPARLADLVARRADHYASFPLQVDTVGVTPAEVAGEIQVRLGRFHVSGMGEGYDVLIQAGCLGALGEAFAGRGLKGPVAVVCDENVARYYAAGALTALSGAGISATLATIPAGEEHKTMHTVQALWDAFLDAGLERGSTVVALGGGVTGDLAGFAAATYLRGIAWAAAPTSLLAMVDASIGGKTGADLPRGKNLVGAFHPPRLVLADPDTLSTLPEAELRSGLAEVVKAGIIADPALFTVCRHGWEIALVSLEELVRRSAAVKIRVIQEDPYEQGRRAALNLGHTFGHALEAASGYQLRHGEAVAIGMVAAARLSERLGLAASGLAEEIAETLNGLGLPVQPPANLDWETVHPWMGVDKKRRGGSLRFVLPEAIGQVAVGVEVSDLSLVREVLYG
jgi:3-dehydroquinate synthase